VALAFDECTPFHSGRDYTARSTEALGRLARAMRRGEEEPLALEQLEAHQPPALPAADDAAAAAPTPELEAGALQDELEALEARLAAFPEADAQALEQARRDRVGAEGALARAEEQLQGLEAQQTGGRLRRGGPDPRALALARQGVQQGEATLAAAGQREGQLERRVPERRAFEAEHAPLRERANELREQLAERRSRHLERALERPGDHLRDALGERPGRGRRREAWERAARAVEGFRFDHRVKGRDALGEAPKRAQQRQDHRRAQGQPTHGVGQVVHAQRDPRPSHTER